MKIDSKFRYKMDPEANASNIIIFKNYRFTILFDNLIRVEKDVFTDSATLTFFFRNTKKVDYSYEVNGDTIIIKTKEITLTYDISKESKDNYVIFNNDSAKEKRYLNNDYNLKGTMRTLDTFFDEGFCVDRSVTKFSKDTLPLEVGLMSKNGVAIIDDRLTPIIKDDMPSERVDSPIDSYLFLYLNDYYKCLRDFYTLTGYPPLIPKFAFGNWWSRYHAYTDKEYMSLLDRFSEFNVPLSVAVIDMDWHYVDLEKEFHLKELGLDNEEIYGSLSGWTGYSFDKHLWKDYKKSFKEIHDRGYKISLNLHPKDGIRWFEDMYNKMAIDNDIDPSTKRVVEFDMTSPKYVNSYFRDVMEPYEEDGCDIWWIDYQQDRTTKIKNLDPLWPLNHYHFIDSKYKLILSRYAGLGSHRYPLGFSGDTKQTYDFLSFMPYFTMNASNVGYTYWSHDIGAHHYGIKDDDLYTRWFEFGVFSPINRIHTNLADVLSKEPWLNKSEVKYITNEYLRLRHRLMPYLYHYSYLTHECGIPLIKPLYYEYPLDEECYKDRDTYYFGKLIVSPIITKRENGYAYKKLYLPSGRYYDLFTRRFYKGGILEVERDLGETPVFIKEGDILPLSNDIYNIDSESKDLEFNIVSDNSNLDFIESDDVKTHIESMALDNNLIINIKSDSNKEFNRDYFISLRHILDGDVKVYVDGKEYPFTKSTAFNLAVSIKNIFIKDEIKIIVSNIERDTFETYATRSLAWILTGENDINMKKESLYQDLLKHLGGESELNNYIDSLDISKELRIRLKEITKF